MEQTQSPKSSSSCRACMKKFAMKFKRNRLLRCLAAWRRFFMTIITPAILSPLLIIGSSEALFAYPVMVMITYWVTESLPLGVTALLPVVLFPLLDVVNLQDTIRCYMTETHLMLFGILMVAAAIEYWDIHTRIALKILLLVGANPRALMLFLMLVAYTLSMFMSGMAIVVLMLPITEAVLQEFEDCWDTSNIMINAENSLEDHEAESSVDIEDLSSRESEKKTDVVKLPTDLQEDDKSKSKAETIDHHVLAKQEQGTCVDPEKLSVAEKMARNFMKTFYIHSDEVPKPDSTQTIDFIRLAKGVLLGICYAANLGGMTIRSRTSPTNLTDDFYYSDSLFEFDNQTYVKFGSCMIVSGPLSSVLVLICWVWLQLMFIGWRFRSVLDCRTKKRILRLLLEKTMEQERLLCAQVVVLVLLVFLIVLLVAYDFGGGSVGWGLYLNSVNRTFPGIFIGVLMFIIPSALPSVQCCRKKGSKRERKTTPFKAILRWDYLNSSIPWHVLLLIGSGFAITEGFKRSGLILMLVEEFQYFEDWNEWLILIVLSFITTFTTELVSNEIVIALLAPVSLGILEGDPVAYTASVILSSSFGFMMPVATPTNAVVFNSGLLATIDMVAAGFFLNLIAVPFAVVASKFLGPLAFDPLPID